MDVIHKHQLSMVDAQVFYLPADAEILSIQVVGLGIYMWVKLDADAEKQKRTIVIKPTGETFDYDGVMCHIDTLQMGVLVWHFFELHEHIEEEFNMLTITGFAAIGVLLFIWGSLWEKGEL